MRANALGVEAHFSQQNVEKTSYESESFGLVTSTLLLHETSHDAVPKIINECFRLLEPGGWMIHLDVYPFHKKEDNPLYDFLKDWEVINNNENFSGAGESSVMFRQIGGAFNQYQKDLLVSRLRTSRENKKQNNKRKIKTTSMRSISEPFRIVKVLFTL